MTPRAVWTPQARQDLMNVSCYIGRLEERPSIAAGVIHDIKAKADMYAESPNLGQHHHLFPEGLQYFRFKRWIVIYQMHPEGIEVMHVIDGSRDLASLF